MTSNRIFSDVENALNLIGACTMYVFKRFFKFKVRKIIEIDVNHVSYKLGPVLYGPPGHGKITSVGGDVKGQTMEWIDKPWWKGFKKRLGIVLILAFSLPGCGYVIVSEDDWAANFIRPSSEWSYARGVSDGCAIVVHNWVAKNIDKRFTIEQYEYLDNRSCEVLLDKTMGWTGFDYGPDYIAE